MSDSDRNYIQEKTLSYLDRLIYFLNKEGDTKTEMYLDNEDFENYDQIKTVIINAMNGVEENGSEHLNAVHRFLKNIGDYYTKQHSEIAPYIDSLLVDLEPSSFERTYNYMTPEEKESVKLIGDKYKLPPEMRREVEQFVGYKLTGGRGRKRRTKRRYKKGKTKTKRRNRTTRKYRTKSKYSRK